MFGGIARLMLTRSASPFSGFAILLRTLRTTSFFAKARNYTKHGPSKYPPLGSGYPPAAQILANSLQISET